MKVGIMVAISGATISMVNVSGVSVSGVTVSRVTISGITVSRITISIVTISGVTVSGVTVSVCRVVARLSVCIYLNLGLIPRKSRVPGWSLLGCSTSLMVSVSSDEPENEDILAVMWCFPAIGPDVYDSILFYHIFVRARDSAIVQQWDPDLPFLGKPAIRTR